MKVRKPKSKRVPVRLRHKIEKASAAKQRKDKKLAKKNPEWRSRLKKDPGIPNLFPFKDRILAEIEEKRKQKEEEIRMKRDAARDAKKAAKSNPTEEDVEIDDAEDLEDEEFDDDEMDETDGDDSNPMAALLASARAQAKKYNNDDSDAELDSASDSEDEDDGVLETTAKPDPSARAFSHLFPEVLSAADLIIYVLDARDPLSTRSIPTERQIAAHELGSKKLLLVLNKADLVPPVALHTWLAQLRRSHPTLPLISSGGAPGAKTFSHGPLTQKTTSETLLRALKSFAALHNLKRALTVGVVGFPNVGKSSVINALVSNHGRKSAPAPTGAEAGVTTSLRKVKLDAKLHLIDSPGVVFPSEIAAPSSDAEQDAQTRLILLNCLPPKYITDPIPAVTMILNRVAADADGMQRLLQLYGIPPLISSSAAGDQTTDFLIQVARKRGRLGRGGIPDLKSAGMSVLADWRDGRLSGWVPVPVQPFGAEAGKGRSVDEKKIVDGFAEEFKIEGLWGPSSNSAEVVMAVDA